MNRLRYILRHRYYLKIFCLSLIIIIIICTKIVKRKSIYNNLSKEFIGIVYKIDASDNKRKIYIKMEEKLIVNDNSNVDINLGDTIKVNGIINDPNNNTIFNLFNYKKYLYYEGIFHVVDANNIQVIKKNTSFVYYLRDKINKRINNISKSSSYIKIFLLGDKSDVNEDIIDSFRINGISHLFSISGMHISLFAAIILYIMKRLSYNNFLNYSIVIFFLSFYVILIGNTPSALRSLIMYILFSMSKLFNLKINKIDIMLLVLLIMLLINPYCIYSVSLEYSYIISFSLVLLSKKISNIKKYYKKTIYISFVAFLVSFPISIYNYYQVNFLGIIYNIFFVPYVSFIVFPLSLISFIIPYFSYILNIFIFIFERISLYLSNIDIGIISFSKPGLIIIVLYYILIFLFFYNYKFYYIFILILLNKLYPYFNNNLILTYLNVGQGDSLLIRLPINNNILIDTGGNEYSSYNISNNYVNYFKSVGISKIDYLILTHGDFDHMGETINMVNNFKVENVIFNCGTYNDLEQELIKVLDKKKIKYYSCIRQLNMNKYKLEFLNTREYDNENDNSNVIYFNYNGYKFLFMGDAGIEKEKDILGKYNLKDIDFLKVGHHGSNTSSSDLFINSINPKYSLISVGKNNRYGHPKDEVLDTLKNSKIYRTDLDGSIEIKLNKNGYKIRTCPP